MILELYPLPEQREEVIESGTGVAIGEEVLLGGLSVPLVEDAKLEVRDEHVLVVVGYQLGGFGMQNRYKVFNVELLVEQLGHLGRVGAGAQAGGWDYLVHGSAAEPQEDAGVLLVGDVLRLDGEEHGAQAVVVAYEGRVFLQQGNNN